MHSNCMRMFNSGQARRQPSYQNSPSHIVDNFSGTLIESMY